MHCADHTADADEVAHLERTQHQHEGPGCEVTEHAAPRRTDGHTSTRQQGCKRRGLDAKVAQDAQHQGDVQRHGHDAAQVLGQRRIDLAAIQRSLCEGHNLGDKPAANHPKRNRREHFDGQFGHGGAQESLKGGEVHSESFQLRKRSPEYQGKRTGVGACVAAPQDLPVHRHQ